jgi:transcriptional regulator with XRE-family HTH domain
MHENPDNKTVYSYLLREALRQKRVTQARLARELGVSRQTVSQWCSSKTMSLKNWHSACAVLGVAPSWRPDIKVDGEDMTTMHEIILTMQDTPLKKALLDALRRHTIRV